jgi:hypothetical protein
MFFHTRIFPLLPKKINMRYFISRTLLVLIVMAGSFSSSFSQTTTNTALLKQAALIQAEKEKILYAQLQTLARQKGWDMVKHDSKGNIALLVGVDGFGLPLYLATESNIIAAATIGTSSLWTGGSTGLNLSGSSINVKDKLAIWDGGRVRATHVELNGRVVQRDAPSAISDHSTHVAGTMIATGVNALAKGMSFGQQELVAYDFGNDFSEMLNESPGLLVSNHSYGFNAGWVFNDAQNRWEFLGNFDANEDYRFGYYSTQSQSWDSIAYNAPYYLIVKSAGNSRNENGPAVGQPYWRYNSSGVMADAGNRPAGISSNDSYDILSLNSTAKNILLVGAINPIPNGYTKPQDVVMSSFSAWGPTDDGRIKPDVVADGVNLLSSSGTSDNAYVVFSGTSMSSPNASGSLLLLQEYYSQLHGAANFMRSATLKGLVIHTADEAGLAPGPDYQNGWGLINMTKAAAVITGSNIANGNHIIQENVLNNGGTLSVPVIASGSGKISATISWTDPKADVESISSALNNTTKKLVNDLDIVIKKGATVYRPWILNPAVPSADATTGDNTRDNVEKVELPDVIPGASYTIEISHKGTLARGLQAYSLIASGVGGQAYCASNPSSTAGARIDSASFANIQNKNAAGCTSYSNFTNLTGDFQPAQTLPVFIRLNSCDATSVDKIVKVYIDSNNDGDFVDAGENIATSAVINGNGDFNGNITVPAGLTPGKYTILRIVMQETSSAAAVTPCGIYTKGETQDYRVLISTPSTDVGVTGLASPQPGECKSSTQYVTIRIRNFGAADKSNIPVTTIVKQGATTVATLNAVFTNTLTAGTEATYTYQLPFTSVAGTTYTFTSSTSLAGDQSTSNDQNISSVTIGTSPADPAGTALICGTNAILNATPATADVFNWYTSATANTPVATGASTTTTTIVPTYYLSKNEVSTKVGPATKLVYPQGGYNIFNDNQLRWIFTASGPLRIENARLYIGQAGKITFTLRKVTNINYLTGAYSYYPTYDQGYAVEAYATAPTTPVPGAPNNDPGDVGAIFYLGIDVPEPGEYAITIQAQNASIFRNNAIAANPYPYTIPGVISVTGNSASNTTDPNYYQQFYYFFYDATIKSPGGCPSNRAQVVATTATAPTISLAANVFTSSSATGNQWFLNGNPIPGASASTYTATASGLYRVEVTNNGCTLASNEINFTVTAIPNVDPDEIGLIVSPNPTNTGQFNIQLETRTRADLFISLISMVGQKVYQFNVPKFIGRLSKQVNPGKLSAGIYYLQVQHDKKMYVKRIVITQ